MEKALVRIRQEQVGEHTEAVVARELHEFLEVGRDFSNWMRARIAEYGWREGTDYEVFAHFGENLKGGRPAAEYLISLDMAKELCMVERNEKGRQARRYFIEAEKKLRQLAADLAGLERQDGAKAMARLMHKAHGGGKDFPWLARLMEYRRRGLTYPEIGKLLDCSKDTAREYAALLMACGYDLSTSLPTVRNSRQALLSEVLPC
ncbi:MAG: antA/AntB antirepressor family protein [Thermodesulfobacteriota bacterium]|nr:antA/AntB antirepressor family protein [Thermodesulfobacteriota bacterium]